MKTIRQLADELGVSKTSVRKYMNPEFRAAHTETLDGNIIVIDEEGCRKIAASIKKPPEIPANENTETPQNEASGDMIALLQTTIETLRGQLEVKDRQIAELTRLADQAQQLHAGTIKQALPEGETAATVDVAPEASESARKKWSWPWNTKKEK